MKGSCLIHLLKTGDVYSYILKSVFVLLFSKYCMFPIFHNFTLVCVHLLYLGQLVVASLLNRNIKARLLVRDPEKARTLFGEQDEDKLQVCFFCSFLDCLVFYNKTNLPSRVYVGNQFYFFQFVFFPSGL